MLKTRSDTIRAWQRGGLAMLLIAVLALTLLAYLRPDFLVSLATAALALCS